MNEKCRLCPDCKTIQYKDRCGVCGYVEIPEVITSDDYFKCYSSDPALYGRDFRRMPAYKRYLTPEVGNNIMGFLSKLNWLMWKIGIDGVDVSSGWRPEPYNVAIGGAKRSKHTQGIAIDISAPRTQIINFFEDNHDLMKANQFAIEHPSYTPSWVHIQLGLPGSGKTIFIP